MRGRENVINGWATERGGGRALLETFKQTEVFNILRDTRSPGTSKRPKQADAEQDQFVC